MNTRKTVKHAIGVALVVIFLAGCDLLTPAEPGIVKVTDLTIESVTLNAEFDWAVLEYSANVPAETETVTVSAVCAADAFAYSQMTTPTGRTDRTRSI